jgi:ribosomal protein S18 acetylase RimI-like enzyme
MMGAISLRNAEQDDQAFVFTLYCDVRSSEVNAWGWPPAQRDAFLKMQFAAQRHSYQAAYPNASGKIVLHEGLPIGRQLVDHTSEGMHLIDIALLAAYRNCGIGSELMRLLLDECKAAGVSLSLQVLRGNAALRLYRRMGFTETNSDQMYIQMQWRPKEKNA